MTRTGLIPARAGKTGYPPYDWDVDTAHPRSRGENPIVYTLWRWLLGSSPLARGKHVSVALSSFSMGLIPARAGKTTPRPSPPLARRAHPRSRGENAAVTGAAFDPKGSSPLARGKRDLPNWRVRAGRLIPARAGKTCARTHRPTHARAHPRSRGENLNATVVSDVVTGSSPLARGKQ